VKLHAFCMLFNNLYNLLKLRYFWHSFEAYIYQSALYFYNVFVLRQMFMACVRAMLYFTFVVMIIDVLFVKSSPVSCSFTRELIGIVTEA